MKIDYKIVILIVAIFLIGEYFFLTREKKIEDVTIITDEKNGEVEKELEVVVPDTVYIPISVPGKPLPQKKQIVVDSTYKAKYEQALKEKDSISAKNLFLESIALNEFKGTLIDNEDIKIDGKFKTRGTLLEYSVDYKIKSDTITYTPEVVYRYPKASLVYGLELGLPTQQVIPQTPVIGVSLGIQNKKGSIVTLGINSEKFVTIGYYKTLKLFK